MLDRRTNPDLLITLDEVRSIHSLVERNEIIPTGLMQRFKRINEESANTPVRVAHLLPTSYLIKLRDNIMQEVEEEGQLWRNIDYADEMRSRLAPILALLGLTLCVGQLGQCLLLPPVKTCAIPAVVTCFYCEKHTRLYEAYTQYTTLLGLLNVELDRRNQPPLLPPVQTHNNINLPIAPLMDVKSQSNLIQPPETFYSRSDSIEVKQNFNPESVTEKTPLLSSYEKITYFSPSDDKLEYKISNLRSSISALLEKISSKQEKENFEFRLAQTQFSTSPIERKDMLAEIEKEIQEMIREQNYTLYIG